MSATTVTSNNSIKAQQRLIQRERERHQRGLQFQDNNVSQVGNPNLTLFNEPIKHEHEDATTKRIKNALGEFTQMKDYIVKNQKQLVGISTSLFRAKDNKANKAKIEQIFSEMKNNIQPLTGLEDNEFPPNLNYSNSVQNFQENEYQNNSNLNVNNFGPEKINEQSCKEQNRIKDIKNVNNNLLKSSNLNKNYQHSDQEDISLDEVSDENESQLNGKTSLPNNKRNLSSMQENDTQSNKNDSYLDNRKKKKIEDNFSFNDNLKPIVNSVNNDTTNPNSDKIVSKNTVFKKIESKNNNLKVEKEHIEKEDDDDSSISSDDSDISSSSSNSSSSDEEENHSENESVSSTVIKSSPNNLNNAININNELNSKNSKEDSNVNINPSTQAPPPQRSWNLSYIYNKLSNNENVSTNNQKSPPVTKAFLKQSLSKDKVENVIDSVVKGSETNEHLFNSESNSSLSSSSSTKLKFDSSKIKKNNSDASVSKTKRQKISQSPRSKEIKTSLKQNDEINSPKSQKSNKKEPKLEKKNEKAESLEKPSKFSLSSKNTQLKDKDLVEPQESSTSIKKETKNSLKSKSNQNNKNLPEIPKNLLVSIDLSLLEKKEKKESKSHQTKSSKHFKKEVESTKKIKESESCQNTKDVSIKKESDFKDKYRSIEKVSSKSDKKSKNNKSSVNVKSDKTEKYESEQEKSDKKSKSEENEEIKESSKKKSKEKSKSSSKKVSFEFKEEVKKDKNSKHKKSKKESKKVESTKEEETKINSTKESSSSESQNNDKNKDKNGSSKSHKESKNSSKDNSAEDSTGKQDQEINLLMEGKRLKHLGDREKDLVKQYCKYLEAALYFLQSARCYENKNTDQPEKSFRTYQNTLNFMKSTLQNKFLKSKSLHSEENKLNTLGLRCLSLTMYHMNKIMTKDIRILEKKINFQLANLTNTADPNKPDHPLIVGNKIQIPIHLYSLMKRQFDHLNLYNESCELWQQTEHILENDTACKDYIEKINSERGLLSLNSNIDDLVPYTITGLKSLNGDYS